MSKRKRILVGTSEIARHLYDVADGFRQLGHTAHTAISWRNPQHPELKYDFAITSPFSERFNKSRSPLIRYPRGLLNRSYIMMRRLSLLTSYDIYVFQYGSSLLPAFRDFPLLKRMGKKIICMFNGDDIRHWTAAETVWESFGLPFSKFYREREVPYTLANNLQTLRMAERYADVIYSIPSQSELAVRPYMHFYVAVNLSLYGHRVPERDVPVVVHAPSWRGLKGTEEIIAALERLRSEGVRFEFRLLEGKTNQEVIRELVDADVVIDQLDTPLHGMLALEGMATGCAVAGGNHSEFIPLPPDRPVLHVGQANVYSQLKRLLTNKALRLRLAYEGRPFVEKYHDYLKVTERMLECVEDKSRKADYYPEFFARDYLPPQDEVIPENLLRLTTEIVKTYGLPEDVDPQDMIARGLMAADSDDSLNDIPRWKSQASAEVVLV
jgi:hypothetical protein